jgi:hypothetical protein
MTRECGYLARTGYALELAFLRLTADAATRSCPKASTGLAGTLASNDRRRARSAGDANTLRLCPIIPPKQ